MVKETYASLLGVSPLLRYQRAYIFAKLYDCLGVSPDASEQVIRAAYREKVVIMHPDRGGDAEVFQSIIQAHGVLINPDRRAVYDNEGEEGLSKYISLISQDMFNRIFGRAGVLVGGRIHCIRVSLEDLYNGGKTQPVTFTRKIICVTCSGKGGKQIGVKECEECSGQGVTINMLQNVPTSSPCQLCFGAGLMVTVGDKCSTCEGQKVVPKEKTLLVDIEPGMKNGQALTFEGYSDQSPGAVTGDAIVVLEQDDHPRFERNGDNLTTKVSIDVLTAIAGGKARIKHLDRRTLAIAIPQENLVRDREHWIVPGKGMPIQQLKEVLGPIVEKKLSPNEDLDEVVVEAFKKPETKDDVWLENASEEECSHQ
ncbi:putative YDJ1-mitochondrial and ER import protein [Ephemerocybe angulata]|uniref:Putative YDJ1-mitochondrial and ER import protein n=1 Tax=Ephemerocybe angulata TaxID=980116 RepID=A0A8H6MD50_9AGAR|nr:putative YDJ1-mitochondrial and ER import protein [Tulosesus angulatus]